MGGWGWDSRDVTLGMGRWGWDSRDRSVGMGAWEWEHEDGSMETLALDMLGSVGKFFCIILNFFSPCFFFSSSFTEKVH